MLKSRSLEKGKEKHTQNEIGMGSVGCRINDEMDKMITYGVFIINNNKAKGNAKELNVNVIVLNNQISNENVKWNTICDTNHSRIYAQVGGGFRQDAMARGWERIEEKKTDAQRCRTTIDDAYVTFHVMIEYVMLFKRAGGKEEEKT